jgi:excisionase family DNA binding protein
VPGRERTLLIDQAAELLGVSRRTVYYRIQEGRLQTIRTRGGSQRVLLSSIEALLRETGGRRRRRRWARPVVGLATPDEQPPHDGFRAGRW